MSLWFWVLTTTMLAVATGFVITPLTRKNGIPGIPRVIMAVLVAVMALGLYSILGSPGAVTAGTRQAHVSRSGMAAIAGERRGKPLASVADLVAGLRARLEQEPDDAGGWLLLARSYDHLGRHQEAMIAYQRARMLGQGDADAGESLSDAGQSVGSAGDSGPAIHGRVALSPEAARLVNPDDTIFIFAKESPDQRIPVAALRKPAAELPIDFVLTDAEAMIPGTRIADFEHLVVTARVSRSGLATDILKGFEVWSEPVSPIDGTEIELTIAAGARTGGHRDE